MVVESVVAAGGCGAMVEGLTGPISGTFGTVAPYSRTEIWVCAGDDGWSDGLQELMVSPPSSPTGCLISDAVAPRGRKVGHPEAPHHQFQDYRAESDDSL